MERTEVMSMEGMEVNLFNGMIYGVSDEVESQSSDALKEAFCFSWRLFTDFRLMQQEYAGGTVPKYHLPEDI